MIELRADEISACHHAGDAEFVRVEASYGGERAGMKVQASHHTKEYFAMTHDAPQGMAEFLLAQVEAARKKYDAMTDEERANAYWEPDAIIVNDIEGTEITFIYDDGWKSLTPR